MVRPGYVALKEHFDKFIRGGYPNNGLERIRDVYYEAFDKSINLYDICQSQLRVSTNPINTLILLTGPDESIKCGLIPCETDTAYVTVLSDDYLKGVNDENINEYIKEVFSTMWNVISYDALSRSFEKIQSSPYCEYLAMCSFYFTFHHIFTCFPHLTGAKAFNDILEKYYCTSDDIEKVMESLHKNRFSTSFEKIYSTMTCNNTIDLFY